MSFVSSIAAAPIRFYRRYISPLKPRMCRFSPTCSQYAIEALEQHGLWRGGCLAVWRLLRCQPFARGGFDPVPPRDDLHSHHPHHPGHLHE
jgi:putative membrane protein insertion efficiency factor